VNRGGREPVTVRPPHFPRVSGTSPISCCTAPTGTARTSGRCRSPRPRNGNRVSWTMAASSTRDVPVDEGLTRTYRVPGYPITPVLFCLYSGYMVYTSLDYAIGQRTWEAVWSVEILLIGAVLSIFAVYPLGRVGKIVSGPCPFRRGRGGHDLPRSPWPGRILGRRQRAGRRPERGAPGRDSRAGPGPDRAGRRAVGPAEALPLSLRERVGVRGSCPECPYRKSLRSRNGFSRGDGASSRTNPRADVAPPR
jgi:hypothetical protein